MSLTEVQCASPDFTKRSNQVCYYFYNCLFIAYPLIYLADMFLQAVLKNISLIYDGGKHYIVGETQQSPG